MRRAFRLPRRTPRDIRDDVDAELRFHLDARTDALTAGGLTPDAARRQALHEFGDVNDARDYMRTIDGRAERAGRRRTALDELRQDVGYAVRALRRAPLFALTAVVTLALGIGANVAIFSVVHGVLLRPLPYPEPAQLYRVWAANRTDGVTDSPVSPVDIDDWRAARRQIADLGGWFHQENGSGKDLTGRGAPQRVAAVFVTAGFYPTLGVRPVVGRLPLEDEMVRGGADHVVMLTYGFWQRQFGGSPSVVGTTLLLGGEPYEVLGVLPRALALPTSGADIHLPYSSIPDDDIPRVRQNRLLGVVARARPGVDGAAVQAELDALARRLAAQYPENAQWDAVTVRPLHAAVAGATRTPLLVLAGAVGCVLLIVCVNVASLLLARAVGRSREMAVRAALGAARGRIVRQLLTESVLLSLAGGVAGLALAWGAVAAVRAFGAAQLPPGVSLGLHLPVLLFALALSLAAGVAFGIVPALRLASGALQQTLRAGGRTMAGGDGQRLRDGLVVAEVALAVVLAVGAGLMARSFAALVRVETGYRPDHVVALTLSLSDERHGDAYTEVGHRLLEAIRALPGVVSAGAAKDAPLRGAGEARKLPLPNDPTDSASAAVLHVSDQYFRTLGTTVVAGREFTAQDDSTGPVAILVNEAFVRRFYPGERLAGRSIPFGAGTVRVLGVVGDIRQSSMDRPAEPMVYVNYRQGGRSRHTVLVRTRGEPLAMVRAIERTVWSIDKDQTIGAVYTLNDAVRDAVARPRLLLVLLGTFGALGLGLGALGIYGVLAYLVSQRPREIGVRLALGATRGAVSGMIVRRGLALTGVGLALGVVGALALGRLTAGVLYGITPTDPYAYLVAVATLGAAALLGSWLPARRAAAVDPAITLRAE